MTFYWGSLIGLFLGFVFGVGCALAVMYSIWMGGYRAALRDGQLSSPPERLRQARAKLGATSGAKFGGKSGAKFGAGTRSASKPESAPPL